MSEVVCSSCGSQQAEGSTYCALCGRQFPRTGWLDESQDRGPVFLSEPAPAVVYVGPGRRILAVLIDGFAIGVVVGLILLIGFFVAGPFSEPGAVAAFLPFSIGSSVVGLGLMVGLWVWQGRSGSTLGNTMCKLRVVDEQTQAPSGFVRAFLWWLLLGISSIVLVLGPVLVLMSPGFDSGTKRQGWLDKIAKVVAIDTRNTSLAGAPAPGADVGSEQPPHQADPWAPPQGAPGLGTSASWSFATDEPQYPAQPQYQGDPQYPAQPQYQGDPQYPAQPQYQGDPQYPAQPQYQGEPQFQGDPQYPVAHEPQNAVEPQVPAESQFAGFNNPTGADPWAPAPPMSEPVAAPAAPDGLITGVPGSSSPLAAAPMGASAPAMFPAPAPPAAPPTVRLDAAPIPSVTLQMESGEMAVVTGPTLVGRNPQAPDDSGWTLISIADSTRSVSKTHLELGVDADGLWACDRGSTNGTIISTPGQAPRMAAPGARLRVPGDSIIHVGDCRIVVRVSAT